MTVKGATDKVGRVRVLYDMVCSRKITDGEVGARAVGEIEKITGKDIRNTQEFHHYVAEFLIKRTRVAGTLGGNLRRARFKAKMTQVELAKELGVDIRTIKRWETDRATPSPEALQWTNTKKGPYGEKGTFEAK
jgi:DNA-binding XRE family transcriptional regulator